METLAMHISNGIINGPVAALFAVIALAAMALCVQRGRLDLDDRLAPMAGLVAAFVFAVQMLNFPIFTAGVSGHLLGGAIAAMLVGPWVGALCIAVVLVVQALVFGDGGVAMLGLSITNMAVLGVAVAYLLIALLLRVLPRTTAGLAVTAFVAALVSVVVAAMGFVLQYWLGGTADLGGNLAGLAGTMAVSHLFIGIGEGLITATTVVTVARVRPDLVYALRALKPAQPATVPTVGGVR
ncbi:energy-coupling factor ABC transporter permease [Micromonospora radicis]|uniref:Cobalamin biosynthesis protein CbiM n=1 Tax=Micromonospora radicis TaxID=1894971 RepID=A0A418MRR0_9ACTN|nr:energy-coupling factor ABC transporter permease [Micromonospora radicis]RIV36753.1 cobalamin biosynthesis protein CbiM [Micromonospora radicis]